MLGQSVTPDSAVLGLKLLQLAAGHLISSRTHDDALRRPNGVQHRCQPVIMLPSIDPRVGCVPPGGAERPAMAADHTYRTAAINGAELTTASDANPS